MDSARAANRHGETRAGIQRARSAQGVADERFVYAIVNTVIGKYYKQSGELLALDGPRGGPIRHINSCYAAKGKLWCSNSNFPEVPMGSSVEVIDTAGMKHESSHTSG